MMLKLKNSVAICVLFCLKISTFATQSTDVHANSFEDATLVNVPSETKGYISKGGDIDCFKFTINESNSVYIKSEGAVDCFLQVYDSSGRLIIENDDSGWSNNFYTALALEKGDYYLKVNGSSKNTKGEYLLNVSNESFYGDDDHFEATNKATLIELNKRIDAELEDVNDRDTFKVIVYNRCVLSAFTTGSTNTFGRLINSDGIVIKNNANSGPLSNFELANDVSPGVYYIEVSSENYETFGGYSLEVNTSADYEINRNGLNADQLNEISIDTYDVGNSHQGLLKDENDIETIKINLSKSGVFHVESESDVDIVGELLKANGNIISRDTNGGKSLNFRIVEELDAGLYFLRIRSNEDKGNYTLSHSLIDYNTPDKHGSDFSDATSLKYNEITFGLLQGDSDSDCFKFTLEEDENLLLRTFGKTNITGRLYTEEGNEIYNYDDSYYYTNYLYSAPLKKGTYYIRIDGKTNHAKGLYSFILEKAIPHAKSATYYSNKSDSRIITVKGNNGLTINVSGNRNSDGLVDMVDVMHVKDGLNDITFHMDKNGLPKKAISDNGCVLEFDWNSDGTAIVDATSHNGELQVSTKINFLPSAKKQYSYQPNGNKEGFSRLGKKIQVFERSVEMNNPIKTYSIDNSISESQKGKVQIEVIDCGTPEPNVDVKIIVRDVSGSFLSGSKPIGSFDTKHIGNGVYEASIPIGQKHYTLNETKCKSIEEKVGLACTVINQSSQSGANPVALCHGMSLAVEALNVFTFGEYIPIMGTCTSVAGAMYFYCDTFGNSVDIGTPSIAGIACEKVFEDKIEPSELELTYYITGPKVQNNNSGKAFTLSDSDNFPLKIIHHLGNEAKIKKLNVVPRNPAEAQDYVATADITCIPKGTKIQIYVRGTDGYSDKVLYETEEDMPNKGFDIIVPGAEKGVRDSIVVRMATPGAKKSKKMVTSLVFGK